MDASISAIIEVLEQFKNSTSPFNFYAGLRYVLIGDPNPLPIWQKYNIAPAIKSMLAKNKEVIIIGDTQHNGYCVYLTPKGLQKATGWGCGVWKTQQDFDEDSESVQDATMDEAVLALTHMYSDIYYFFECVIRRIQKMKSE